MKLKVNAILMVLFALVSVFILSACSAQQGFVSLPEDVQNGVGVIVLLGISYAFAYLITLLPFLQFLDQFKVPLAAAIATQLISIIQAAVPDAWGNVVIYSLRALLALLAIILAGQQFKKRGLI